MPREGSDLDCRKWDSAPRSVLFLFPGPTGLGGLASHIAALFFGNVLPATVGSSLLSAFASQGCRCLILSLHERSVLL